MDKKDIFEILTPPDVDDVSNVKINVDSQEAEMLKKRIMTKIEKPKKAFLRKRIVIGAACILVAFTFGIALLTSDHIRWFGGSIIEETSKPTEGEKIPNTPIVQATGGLVTPTPIPTATPEPYAEKE